MLAAMPVFHGFGLGVCIHTMMVIGGESILVPRFNVKAYANLIKKNKPNFIAGVPTLFEAITRNPYLDGVSLDFLRGVFSGGDSLSIELKKKFDKFLMTMAHPVHVSEGYGTRNVYGKLPEPRQRRTRRKHRSSYPIHISDLQVEQMKKFLTLEEGEICLSGTS